MKNILLFFSFCLCFFCNSQQGTTLSDSIFHDGIYRSYILYVPPSFTQTNSAPLILNFHGLGSNASQQYYYGDFRGIADTAGFLIVHPEGTIYQGSAHWNVGGFTSGSTVDDVGFTNALLDTLSNQYNIDSLRIYSTGMSNGGYMSFLLACQLSHRITAVASVTGSMTPQTYNACNPQHPTPVMQIHGTADPVVPYNGDTWTKSIDEVNQYWVTINNCNTTPSITDVPNTSMLDQSTVKHYLFNNGINGSTVEHFKVIGGEHTWPGFGFGISGTNYDIEASIEIWRFFSQQSPSFSSINTLETNHRPIIFSPNPSKKNVFISSQNNLIGSYEITDLTGKRIENGSLNEKKEMLISIELLKSGTYLFKISKNGKLIQLNKIIKQ